MWWMEQKDSRSYVNIHALWYHKERESPIPDNKGRR